MTRPKCGCNHGIDTALKKIHSEIMKNERALDKLDRAMDTPRWANVAVRLKMDYRLRLQDSLKESQAKLALTCVDACQLKGL